MEPIITKPPEDAYSKREISLRAEDAQFHGTLVVPKNPIGVVIFAHGSGSSRFSPRNRYVAGALQEVNFATFLIDLLSDEEAVIDEETREYRFNIELLSQRLLHATYFVEQEADLQTLPIGYFGASTGAAVALVAADRHPHPIKAIVSRGGRPDLAGEALTSITIPTLLIVGGEDQEVIELNQQALKKLSSPSKKLEIIPGATHLFEEEGALEQVSELARKWFTQYLSHAK